MPVENKFSIEKTTGGDFLDKTTGKPTNDYTEIQLDILTGDDAQNTIMDNRKAAQVLPVEITNQVADIQTTLNQASTAMSTDTVLANQLLTEALDAIGTLRQTLEYINSIPLNDAKVASWSLDLDTGHLMMLYH